MLFGGYAAGAPELGGWRGYSPLKISRFKYIALRSAPQLFAGSSAIVRVPPTFSIFRQACYVPS